MERIKSLPLKQLMLFIYPNLYPIHNSFVNENDWPSPVQLSFANIERNGVYLLDTYDNLFVYICKSVHPHWLSEVFNVTQWAQIPDDGDAIANNQTNNIQPNRVQTPQTRETRPIIPLPQLENMTSKRIHAFINSLIEERPFQPNFHVLRYFSLQCFILFTYALIIFIYFNFFYFLTEKTVDFGIHSCNICTTTGMSPRSAIMSFYNIFNNK